jgi:hypothetical protein
MHDAIKGIQVEWVVYDELLVDYSASLSQDSAFAKKNPEIPGKVDINIL